MQLHEFVDAATADAPPPVHTTDDIVAAGRRAERRRHVGFASVGAAGTAGLVAVAVAGAVVLPSSAARRPSTPRPAIVGAASNGTSVQWTQTAPFTFSFRGYDAGRFHVQDPIVASTAYQISSVYEDGHTTNDRPVSPDDASGQTKDKKAQGSDPTLYAYLTVYRSGAFDPSRINGGTALTVAGHKAIEATLPAGLDPKNATVPGNKELAWEYTDNAWAVVTSVSGSSDDPSFADLGGLVTGLKPGTPQPAKLPFTVGYVPAGYQPVQIGVHAMPGLDGIAAAREGDYGGATYARPTPATSGLSAPFDSPDGMIKGSFNIFVTPSGSSNQKAQPGRTACYTGGFCNVWSADGTVQIQVSDEDTGANLPASELTRIAQSIKVADVTDETTWTAAATALHP